MRLVFTVFSTFSFPGRKQGILRESGLSVILAACHYFVKEMTFGYVLFTLSIIQDQMIQSDNNLWFYQLTSVHPGSGSASRIFYNYDPVMTNWVLSGIMQITALIFCLYRTNRYTIAYAGRLNKHHQKSTSQMRNHRAELCVQQHLKANFLSLFLSDTKSTLKGIITDK